MLGSKAAAGEPPMPGNAEVLLQAMQVCGVCGVCVPGVRHPGVA
jgi:hypothetical protein